MRVATGTKPGSDKDSRQVRRGLAGTQKAVRPKEVLAERGCLLDEAARVEVILGGGGGD